MLEPKIINVFYGADLLPYKDKERTVHFPIVGNSFTGASNATEIRFYVDQIGDLDLTWAANTKLPNGKTGTKVITGGTDENGTYVSLQLSTWYTQLIGDLYIGLQGYSGGINYTYDSETGLYTLYGTPTIQATGVLKVHISYSTPFNGDSDIDDNDLQNFIAYITEISKRTFTIFADIENADISSFATGHLFYDIVTKQFYEKSITSPYYEEYTLITSYHNVEELIFNTGGSAICSIYCDGDLHLKNSSIEVVLTTQDIEITSPQIYVNGTLAYPNFVERDIVDIYEDETLDNLTAEERLILYSAYKPYILLDDGTAKFKIEVIIRNNNTATALSLLETSELSNNIVNHYGKIIANGTSINYYALAYNLYKKGYVDNNIYTKAQVDSIIESVKSNEFQVVESLPTTGEEGIIYLVETSTSGVYDKYIYESDTWVFIGTTEIDLSDYYTKEQANAMFVYKDNDNAIGGDNTFNGETTFKGNTTFHNNGNLTIDSNIVYLHAETQITDYDLYFLNSNVDNTTANIRYYLYGGSYVAIGVPSADYLDFVVHYNSYQEVALEVGYHFRDSTLTPEVLIHGDGCYDGEITQNISLVNKKYVDDNVQAVREIAAGKCSNFVIKAADTIAIVKDKMTTYASNPSYDALLWNNTTKQFESIKQDIIDGDYDNYSYGNIGFASTNDTYADTSKYLIFEGAFGQGDRGEQKYYFIYLDTNTDNNPFKVGDNIFVVEQNVPDRWYSGGTTPYYFNRLEIGEDYVRKQTSSNTVYGINGSGNQTLYPVSETAPSNYQAIPIYGSLGTLQVNTLGISNVEVANVGFVNDKIAQITNPSGVSNPTTLNYGVWNDYSFSANATINFVGADMGKYPEFRGTIENTSTNSITVEFLTPLKNFLCNDDSITISSDKSTILLPANTTIEFSIIDLNMVAINFEA